MTTPAQTPYVAYLGNGVSSVFAYPFYLLDATHLKVYRGGVLQPGGSYTLTGIGATSGGNVTFSAPPVLDQSIIFIRDVPATQLVDYHAYDAFPAEVTEQALDKLTMLVQDALNAFGNAVVAPPLEQPGLANLVLPSIPGRANLVMGFDSQGNILMYVPGAGGGGTISHSTLLNLSANDHPQYLLVADAAAQYLKQVDATLTYLAKAGDVMTGPLTLSSNPTLPLHAATKQYADLNGNHSALSNLGNNDHPQYLLVSVATTNYLPLAGGTLTGPLVLAGNPAAANQAANKAYVDTFTGSVITKNVISNATGDAQPTVHQAWNAQANANAITRAPNEIIFYRWPGASNNVFRYLGTQSGPAGWASAATDWAGSAGVAEAPQDSVPYVRKNAAWVAGIEKTGGAFTGKVQGSAGAAAAADLARTDEVTASVNAGIAAHSAAANPHAVYQLKSEKANASGYASLDAGAKVPVAQIPDLSATYLAKTGGVMTGQITLPGGGSASQAVTLTEAQAAGTAGGNAAVTTHVGQADPHNQYQLKSQKGVANGYAGLDAGGLVPVANLPPTSTVDVARTWMTPQRANVVVDNDGSFDMNAGNDFSCTVGGNITIAFTNITVGQRGMIYWFNPGTFTVAFNASVYHPSDAAVSLGLAGSQILSYWCPLAGVVMLSNSGILAP